MDCVECGKRLPKEGEGNGLTFIYQLRAGYLDADDYFIPDCDVGYYCEDCAPTPPPEKEPVVEFQSRDNDPTMMICGDCGWTGQAKDCRHGYAPCPPDDVEPMDYCPSCDSENLVSPWEQVECVGLGLKEEDN